MAIIHISEPCLKCLGRLISTTVESACLSKFERQLAFEKARQIVEQAKHTSLSPANVANRFHAVIRRLCKKNDPFWEQKREEMLLASRLAHHHRPADGSSLRELLLFALRGNAIDFFRPARELEWWLSRPISLGRDEIDEFEKRLQSRLNDIIWLADNAGEVYFDLPVVRELHRRGHRIYYCVKDGPVQNDLTIADIASLLPEFDSIDVVSTGAATVGLEWEQTSPSFRTIWKQSQLVIAKGMGHFETLYGIGDKRIFYLFMAKCEPVAQCVGVSIDQFMASFEN